MTEGEKQMTEGESQMTCNKCYIRSLNGNKLNISGSY